MTQAVDVFSMGFVFYEIIAGGLPFEDTNPGRRAFIQEKGGILEFDRAWHGGYVEVSIPGFFHE